jgi:DNA polymerase III alpha subunit
LFVHLHLHSEYSLLDGAARINNAVSKAREMEMPALAIRTRTALSGLPKVIGNSYGAIINYLTEIGEQPADAPKVI